MENLLVVIPQAVSLPMLRELVESQGGYWHSSPTSERGVIEQGKGRIFIELDYDIGLIYDEGELARLRRFLGAGPMSVVDVMIGHAAGSRPLANKFAKEVVDLWGGYIDNNLDEVEVP